MLVIIIKDKPERAQSQHYHELIRDHHVFQVRQPDDQHRPAREYPCRGKLYITEGKPDEKTCESCRIYPSPRITLHSLYVRVRQLRSRLFPVIAQPSRTF